MAKKHELTTRVDVQGGYGKAARWEWSVNEGHKILESGTIVGAESKAWVAAKDAKRRWEEHRRLGKKGKPRTPVKWGNFIR